MNEERKKTHGFRVIKFARKAKAGGGGGGGIIRKRSVVDKIDAIIDLMYEEWESL